MIAINQTNFNFLLRKIKNKYLNSKGNIENLLFAYKIAKNLKVKDESIIKALNKFKGLPHRQESIFSNKKIKCINDSKATSFAASLQSLLSYNKIYWIVGGLPKKQDKFNLKNVSRKIVKAYIIGKTTNFFAKKLGDDVRYKISYDIKNAIIDIFKDIKKTENTNYTILLSPAAASYDQFANFEDRGNYFKKLIKEKFNV